MKAAIIGGDGQLGSDIGEIFTKGGHEVFPLTHEMIEISSQESVFSAFSSFSELDVIVNTAAMHHVENCESEPIRAFAVNGVGALYLSLIANKLNAMLIHVSTDYVFDGLKKQPYTENDIPLPLNVYANTKLAGEYFVRANAKKYLVVRVSGIYGKNPCITKGYNFVDLMIKLSKERNEIRVVDSEVLTPTYTEEIAAQIIHMVQKNAQIGLYHITAEGSCSWYEFAKEIFSQIGSQVTLNVAASGEFAAKVNRPEYSVLENQRLKDQGLNIMRPWREGLTEFIKSHRKNV